jgi:ubiquinol-cytochrome c reductase cytochrome b subunit
MTRRLSINKQPLLSTINDHLIDYPTPSNLTYWWGFGSLVGICLVIQIATGVFLAMHYTPHVDLAFNSVEHIMRDVEGGWLLRYMHANGASMFFIVVYLHIFRGFYYGSYASPRELVWCAGVVILLLMIITAFIGYVLPWGQMSFWGATVITSLASAIPVVGDSIVTWLWGGFSVDNATLNRFFSLHYLLPFIIAAMSIIHIAALHQYGSNNPLGTTSVLDKISFYPYFFVKDVVGWVAFTIFFSIFIFYAPNVLGHPDNYIPANPMSTPAHIVPEWYFLPVYAILRSIPNKLGGVLAIALVFVSLFALPFINTSYVRSSMFRPIHKKLFWLLVADCLLLGWLGSQPVEDPYVTIGQIASFVFFCYFLLTPLLGWLETRSIILLNKSTRNSS